MTNISSQKYPWRATSRLARPLAVLGLLATAGAARAQAPLSTPASGRVAPHGLVPQSALGVDATVPGSAQPSPAPARPAAPGTATTQRLTTAWTTMAAMSQARAEPGAVAHPDGKIYVWGGYGPGKGYDGLTSAEAYTPATNTWAAIASLPAIVFGPATAVGTDGSIYSFGGRNSNTDNYYIGNSYKYSVATNTWTAIAPLPVVRWEARALTASDGRIFVFGGWNAFISPSVGAEVQIYTPATNTWSTGATMPVALFGSAAGVDAAGLMHVYGGITTSQSPSTAHLVYNVATNSWATAPATPTPARAYTTGIAGPDGSLYLCGGDDDIVFSSANTYYSQVDSYNPTTATWSSEPALPVALTEAASAATGGYLYVVGGFTGTAQSTLYRVAVTAAAAPTLTSISPNPAAVGTSVTLTGSNLTGATAVTFAGTSNNTVTTGLTVNGTGSSQTITVIVPAGATSGNVTVATPSGPSNGVVFTVITPATAAPTLTSPANNSLTNGQPTYAGTAPAGSTVTVYLAAGSTAAQAIGTATATGGTFSLTPTTGLASGTYAAYATAQSAGASVSAASTTSTFTVDATPPTATITTTAASPTSTSPIPVTVAFSEAVTGFSTTGIIVTNGTITSSITNAGNAYSFSVTPTADGAVSVSVAANAAQDAAGNGNPAAGPLSVTYTTPVSLTTWTGAISTDWYTAGNWTAGVPTVSLDAIVPVVSPNRYPLISAGTASVRSLTLNSGASLNQGGGTLLLRGDLTNNGTYTATAGTVATNASTPQTLGGSSPLAFQGLNIGAAGASLATSTSFQRALTLTGNLSTNGQALTLLSRVINNGSVNVAQDGLVVNNGGVVVGAVTVQRALDGSLNPGLGYRHYAAPVSNATVADLATASFAPVVNPVYNTSATPTAERPFPTVYGYDESRLSLTNNLGAFDKGFVSPAALSDPLTVGQGYTVNISAGEVVDFTGTLNNGPLTLPLTSTRATYPDGGWQLLGNPYPAPLDYSRVVVADRQGLEAAIYIYSSTGQYAGRYRTYVNGIGNPLLPVGQGFFARVAAGQPTASLTFRNSQRLTVPSGTTMQRTAAEARPLVQLTLTNPGGTLADDAYVYFETGATAGFDAQYDAVKLPNTNGLNLSAASLGQQLTVDGLPELGSTQRVIPLAVGVPTAGTYTLTAAQLLNLATTPVSLRDAQAGTLTDLRLTPSYQFTVGNAAALLTGRFELVFSPQQALATVPAALAQQVALYPNPAKKAAFVELPASLGRQAVVATVVDALGRQLRTITLPPQGALAHQLDLAQLPTGVYALRLSTSAGVVVKKLVVE